MTDELINSSRPAHVLSGDVSEVSRVGTLEMAGAVAAPGSAARGDGGAGGVVTAHGAGAREAADPCELEDHRLVCRAAAGDRTAFQLLVERYRSLVYRVAYQVAGNHHDAEDIAQDVFVKVFRSLDRFRQDARFSSWLYRITMNACIDHHRRRGPEAGGEQDDLVLASRVNAEPGPEQRAYAGELGEVLQAAIDRLPPRQKLIFVMRHFEELKLGEIASGLGLAEGTVKRQLHAAVHRLRHLLRQTGRVAREQPS